MITLCRNRLRHDSCFRFIRIKPYGVIVVVLSYERCVN
nr:MAG TPA_asm: hypothetical protein [Caudoviricetes sp.]